MLLVIDVGNSHTVFGLYEHDEMVAHWRVVTASHRTADELRILFLMLLQEGGYAPSGIDGCCVSTVVPELHSALQRMSLETFNVDPLFVGPGIRTGLIIQVESPKEVVADRIVNTVGAFDEYGGPLIVVDFGTATTLDVVTERSEYIGGAIVPGIEISAEALAEKCAKLPRVEITKPDHVIARDTVSHIRVGLSYGYADLVDGLIRRMSAEMGSRPRVIATGGIAPLIADISTEIETVDNWLTLKGLRVIYHKNQEVQA